MRKFKNPCNMYVDITLVTFPYQEGVTLFVEIGKISLSHLLTRSVFTILANRIRERFS